MTHPAPRPSDAEPSTKQRRLVDIAPLRESPAFARLWIGTVVSGIGTQMSLVAVGLQIYAITDSTFAVGLVGGVSLLPMIVAGLWGGVLADVFDRRRVMLVSAVGAWTATLALAALAIAEAVQFSADGTHIAVWPFYIATTVHSIGFTITATTRGSVTARILPPELISRAAALRGIGFGTTLTVGPALAGIVAASAGLAWTFVIDAILFTAVFLGIYTLPPLPRLGERVRAGLPVLREGFGFLRRSPNIRMSFIADLIAMTFGRPYAMLPAIGAVIAGGGALTVGALTAAGAVGTILTSVFSGPVARVHRHGLAIARSIAVYGGFVAMFGAVTLAMGWIEHDAGPGLAGVYWPALVLLALAMFGMGASDEVSSIFRQTMIIQAAPDHMRGRLQGVFIVVVTGGPRVGDMYVGLLALAVGVWFPSLLGGLLIIGLISVLARARFNGRDTAFVDYDERHPAP